MDTKSRSIRYSIGVKAAAVIILWVCIMSIAGNGIYLLYKHEILGSNSYFDTYSPKSEFTSLVYDTIQLNLKFKSEDNIKAIGGGESTVNSNIRDFRHIEDRLRNTVNYIYYIKNIKTGETITNFRTKDPLSLIKEQTIYIYSNQWSPNIDNAFYLGDTWAMVNANDYKIYAAVLEPLKIGDEFYNGLISFNKTKGTTSLAIKLLVSSILAAILTAFYLISVSGRRSKGEKIKYSFIDRIYVDIHFIIVLIAAITSFEIVINGFDHGVNGSIAAFLVVFGIDVFIGISYVLSMVRQIKGGKITENTLFCKMFRKFKMLIKFGFNSTSFKPFTLVLLGLYGLINGILFVFASSSMRAPFVFTVILIILVFNIAAFNYMARYLVSLTKIMQALKQISVGNLDFALHDLDITEAFSGVYEDVKSIQGGMRKAVDAAIKGERMRTDLITNVSHDLKTPLTSIVNYVDLLKRESLDNEKANEYVSILEEKSQRLKQLIEDLLEASKASSGNIATSPDKLDLQELILQACGEFEEKLQMADLELHFNKDEEKIFVYADGKQMWRIIENLLSNVIKYSMPHSRVYINLEKKEDNGVILIKNISAFPLNITPEQLTERFVRGDLSRSTEGSGLGLSIAESLVNLQGGRFKVEIDGDLFKVSVEVPLWKEI